MTFVFKRVLPAIAGAALAAMATVPAAAQYKSDGFEFLEAVKKRDGSKATELLDTPGNVLVNTRDITSGETALHVVTQRRDSAWLKFLLQRGANPNIESRAGVAPLELATQLGFIDGVEVLLDSGAAVDPSNNAGETPLIAAVHRGDLALIRLLIAKGANPEKSDSSGRTAREYAKLMSGRGQILETIEQALSDKSKRAPTYGPN